MISFLGEPWDRVAKGFDLWDFAVVPRDICLPDFLESVVLEVSLLATLISTSLSPLWGKKERGLLQIVCGNALLSPGALVSVGTSHLTTALGALAASPDTLFHVAYLFATPGASITGLGADSTELAA